MIYDFDAQIDRSSTDCYKWDCLPGELPMWVADMDFEVSKPIQEALSKRISKPIFGYTKIPDRFFPSYVDFLSQYGLKSEKQEYCYSNGVIPTLSCCIRCFSKEEDNVVLLTPVYQVFSHIIKDNKRNVLEVELEKKENGKQIEYGIPWDKLEKALSVKETSLFILCSPHNPVGRVWTKEEMARIGDLCQKHNVLVLSDEVHGPLSRKDSGYIPYAASSPICRDNSISAFAPTKSFNIAGIQTSVAYIPNKELRENFAFGINRDEGAEGNAFSYISSIAALDDSRDWLSQCVDYIFSNADYAVERITKETKCKVSKLEATYLLWVDVSSYKQDDEAFCLDLRKKTGLWITPGSTYGKGGQGFVRINLATNKKRVEDGISRFISYLKTL